MPTMDYLAFTKLRTEFLRFYYSSSASPFLEMRRKIEACETPFQWPPGYEDAEPPFLGEWEDAGNALDLLGQSVASFLSATLRLYIEHWVEEVRRRAGDAQLIAAGVGVPRDAANAPAFKKGWLQGYRSYCEKLHVNWADCPADLTLLEELALARNAVQHPTDITSMRVRQTKGDADRNPRGAFVDPVDLVLNENTARGSRFLRPPRLDFSAGTLANAFDAVDAFCEWLDEQHPMRMEQAPKS